MSFRDGLARMTLAIGPATSRGQKFSARGASWALLTRPSGLLVGPRILALVGPPVVLLVGPPRGGALLVGPLTQPGGCSWAPPLTWLAARGPSSDFLVEGRENFWALLVGPPQGFLWPPKPFLRPQGSPPAVRKGRCSWALPICAIYRATHFACPCPTMESHGPGSISPCIHAGWPACPSATASFGWHLLLAQPPREDKNFLLVGPRGPSPLGQAGCSWAPEFWRSWALPWSCSWALRGGELCSWAPSLSQVAARGPLH
jgi:hypothetical protein